MALIGRIEEIKSINRIIISGKPEFTVVYGRRRIGKTYLMKQHFNNSFTFYTSGLASQKIEVQLSQFYSALNLHPLYKGIRQGENWMEAFRDLIELLEKDQSDIKTIFIDELPLMDVKNSELFTAIDFFWNTWANARIDIKLFVCGSSASWMINNLLKNT